MVTLAEKVAGRYAAKAVKADNDEASEIRKVVGRLKKTPDLMDMLELERRLTKYSRSIQMSNAGIAQDLKAVAYALENVREHVKAEVKESLKELEGLLDSMVT